MTEHETDPQRRPADTGSEPSYPTAELPGVERGQSDSTPPPPVSADPTVPPAAPVEPAAQSTNQVEAASAHQAESAPPVASTEVTTPIAPVEAAPPVASAPPLPAGQPPMGGYPPPTGYLAVAGEHPGAPAHVGGYPSPAPYPGNTWQPGWPTNPGYPGQSGPMGVPPQPPHLGGPVPPWAVGPAPAAGPGRFAKFAVAGVVALALMAGSGIAGGVAALALDGDSGGRTYTAAPIINSADLPAIAAKVASSVVSITTGTGEGSGVVLSADGYVLTNNHVVATAEGDTVRVVFTDGRNVGAKIIGTDPKTDLAVLKADGVSGLSAAKFGDSDGMQVGDTVLALGSPLGLQGSVTAGIISARDRTIQAGADNQRPQQGGASSISGLLQTDAPINPGNSGGALINTRGEVIGINTAIATAGQGTGNIGVGFAIPSNKAKAVAEQLQRGEKVSHPSLGVAVNTGENGGALVGSVNADSPAAKAGLREGDIITRFGDKVISESNDLVAAVQGGKVGDRVELTYTRNGAEAKVTVTLAETS